MFLLAVQIYSLSPQHRKRDMSMDTYRLLAQMLCFWFPHMPVHCRTDRAVVPQSLPLNRQAVFFDYVIVDGKRYYASRTVGSNCSSFVHVHIPTDTLPRQAHGEILEIFQLDQNFHGEEKMMWFARMRWFKPWGGETSNLVWNTLYVASLFIFMNLLIL